MPHFIIHVHVYTLYMHLYINVHVRYIDDLLTLNNTMFEGEICNIYPTELTLKKTTECTSRLSYLDISISIYSGRYITELYDKRDNFNFEIVNFPYMCSNIPVRPTYGVYVSQLIRICRICDNFDNFASRHRLVTNRLIKQGFWYTQLCKTFKKFAKRHTLLFNKYGVSVRMHIQQGICFPLEVRGDLSRNVTVARGSGRGGVTTWPGHFLSS